MPVRQLFPTLFYDAPLGDDALVAALDHACRALAVDDGAGRRWSKANGYRGYTSYASLDDLPKRDPDIAMLVKKLDRHVAAFADAAAMELCGQRLKLDSLWVNVLKPGGGHSGHIHPHSVVSGTIYVAVPPGSGALRIEDPRLPMMMAAPTRRPDAPEAQSFVYLEPVVGTIYLWESWLRHEVVPHAGRAAKGEERISISFNYA